MASLSTRTLTYEKNSITCDDEGPGWQEGNIQHRHIVLASKDKEIHCDQVTKNKSINVN